MTARNFDTPVNLRVPAALLAAVDRRADRERLTRSELIRKALAAAVERAA